MGLESRFLTSDSNALSLHLDPRAVRKSTVGKSRILYPVKS